MIGAGEPALPGISIGHNGTIAFGLTIFNVDQEDLYVYEVNPADLNQYRYQGGWETMRIIARVCSSFGAGTCPSAENSRAKLPSPRHGATLPRATFCTPGSSRMRRVASR